MPRKTPTLFTILLLIVLLGATTLWGQNYGRITVRVKDAQGQPIPDASITITCDELPDYRAEVKTKKKGQVTIAFADATKYYKLKVEKEGLAPTEVVVKAELRSTTEQDVILSEKPQAAPAEPRPQAPTGQLSPSEKLFNEGVEVLQAGDMEAAKAKFLEAIAKNDKLAPAHSALSAIYLEQQNYAEAIVSANAFLALSPDHPTGYRVLYDAYAATGQEAEAEAALAKLTSLGDGGDYAILMYNEGVEALRQGQNEVAKSRFKEALEADPELGAASVGLGRIILSEGDFEGAAALAENALAQDPRGFSPLLLAYEAYTGLGNTEKASEAFSGLTVANPKRVGKLFYDKGVREFNADATGDAIESFQRALDADPEMAQGYLQLGIAQVSAGAAEEAKKNLRLFLEMAPDDPEVATAKEMLGYLGN